MLLNLFHNQGRGSPLGGDSGIYVPPYSGTIDEGTQDGGDFNYTQSCTNSSYWIIQETSSGINVKFVFKVIGRSKKVKLVGRWSGSNDELLSVQAWNGTEWVHLDYLSEELVDNLYIVDLGDQYTIDGITQIRVYRTTGTDDKLYLNCISVLADGDATEDDPPVDEPTILTRQTISGVSGSFGIITIDSGEYKELKLSFSGATSDPGVDSVLLRFGTESIDDGSNYWVRVYDNFSATAGTSETSIPICRTAVEYNNSDRHSAIETYIMNLGAGEPHVLISHAASPDSDPPTPRVWARGLGGWNDSGEILKIYVFTASGSGFNAGSKLVMYGYK